MADLIGINNDINVAAVDRFTLVHLVAGAALGKLGVSGLTAAGVAVGWELVENKLKDASPSSFPHPSHDTPANSIVDAMAMIAGWALFRSR